MTVIYTGPSEYQFFIERMKEFPFLRIAIFSSIASFIFKHILLMRNFSEILLIIAVITFIARIFTPLLGMVEHKFSIIWMWCLFISIECNTIITRLSTLIENASSNIGIGAGNIFLKIFGIIGWISIIIGALAFLARIFIAFFSDF